MCIRDRSDELIDPQKTGKSQGTLFIVGTGPGSPKWRLPEAEEMLKNSSDWVGYGLYLDLIADLNKNRFGKEHHRLHRFELGQEEKRVRHALNLAAQGKIVALISSGDPEFMLWQLWFLKCWNALILNLISIWSGVE